MSLPSVSVLGAGGWGTAIALLMARQGLDVPLWGHDPEHVEAMRAASANEKYLPGVAWDSRIRPTSRLADCASADVVFLAVPSRHLGTVASGLASTGTVPAVAVCCSKGIGPAGRLLSEVLAEQLPGAVIAVLSGPNLAGEIARGLPAAGVIGCKDPAALTRVRRFFEGTPFRAYSGGDVRGIQLGGALKNIYAIGAGISDGLGLGENARSGLVTRALAEMTRLGVAMGGSRETFCGLSGAGDLMLTCFSSRSRNHQVGFRLAAGEGIGAIIASMSMVAEGVPTTANAFECARRLAVDTPIIDAIHAVLRAEKSPAEAMRSLMARELRSELWDRS
jgi:glycerol-3-phosphate dehydrogenase (NAD(P)+)